MGEKVLWKYMLCRLNNENYCLNTPTKHPFKFYLHKMTRIHKLSNSKNTQFRHREDLQHIKEVKRKVVIKDI